MTAPRPSIVLIQPEIPGNTGSIGRTCVALDMELILIHPLGFEITDSRVKRAGLDYWPHVRLTEYASWDAFLAAREPRPDQLFLFEEFGAPWVKLKVAKIGVMKDVRRVGVHIQRSRAGIVVPPTA